MRVAVLGVSFVMCMASLIAAVPQVVDMQQHLRGSAEKTAGSEGYVQLSVADSNQTANQSAMERLVSLPAWIMLLFVIIPVIAVVLGVSLHFGRI